MAESELVRTMQRERDASIQEARRANQQLTAALSRLSADDTYEVLAVTGGDDGD